MISETRCFRRCVSTLGQSGPRSLLAAVLTLLLIGSVPMAASQQASAEGSAAEDIETRTLHWNRYATAMARHSPLGRVSGLPERSLCPEVSVAAMEKYRDALDYARDMHSYSLIVWRDGVCELAHYFPPYTRDLRPESASMHKSVVGLALAAAIADGFIDSVDDPIGKYLSAWEGDPRGKISLRDVVTMASGLEPLSVSGGIDSPAANFVIGPVDARQVVLNRPVQHPPGSVFHYSGFNTQLLLLVLEAATGERYSDYLSRRLWQRIGAGDAFTWNYAASAVSQQSMPRAYTALLAKAEDWLRVGLLIKNFGRFMGEEILPKAMLEAATRPSKANPNYAWQLWLGTTYQSQRFYNQQQSGPAIPMAEPFLVEDMIYFDGFGGQRVYISRSEDLVIVRQGDMRIDWDDAILPNRVLRAGAQ